jgi:hypothetical protein
MIVLDENRWRCGCGGGLQPMGPLKKKKKRSDGWMRLVWGKGMSVEETKPRELYDIFG